MVIGEVSIADEADVFDSAVEPDADAEFDADVELLFEPQAVTDNTSKTETSNARKRFLLDFNILVLPLFVIILTAGTAINNF